jgi:lactoylglutathione lyase
MLPEIFTRKVFAAQPVLDVPGMTEFELRSGTKLGLMENDRIAKIIAPPLPHPGKASGIPRCELYLYPADPQACIERALEAGAVLVSPFEERNWGDRAGYIADPDGHVLAFAEKS